MCTKQSHFSTHGDGRWMSERSWHIFQGDADLVFDPDPDTVWRREIQRTERRLVAASPSLPVGASKLH
jgi:hypothetical protein